MNLLIGKTLKRLLHEHDLTQEEVASSINFLCDRLYTISAC